MYYPIMGCITKKIKKNRPYWYYVESGRVNGKPRIVRQVYLGSPEKLLKAVESSSRPMPLKATARAWGLPGALWLAAVDSGLWHCLLSIWPGKRNRPSIAHYLLLAAIHRICDPGPKTQVQDWYAHSVLRSVWKIKPSQFASQDFWDAFDQIDLSSPFPGNDLSRFQLNLLERWKQQNVIGEILLAYDSTNFYTYIDSKNDRCQLAQRGHNKQHRNNLKQVGLSYVLDAASGIGIYHHVYPGNITDVEEFAVSLPRLVAFLDHAKIPRSHVTLVFDKGVTDLANILAIEEYKMGWIAAIPWNHLSERLRQLPIDQLQPCSSRFPGVRAYAEQAVVEGDTRRCVIQHSSIFASEQLHGLMANVAKAMRKLRLLAQDIGTPKTRPFTKEPIAKRVNNILAPQWVKEVIKVEELSQTKDATWCLQFHIDNKSLGRLMDTRLGRTVLATNRLRWSTEQIINAYNDQSHIEREFRSLKNGEGCSWWPMFHWTDSKITVHAFYCSLGLSLLHYLHYRVKKEHLDLTVESMVKALDDLQDIVVVYPRQGKRGPYPTTAIDTRETVDQVQLITILELERLRLDSKG